MDAAALVREYMAAWPHDFDRLRSLRSDDWVEEWPQSGERIRGDANYRAIHERYPGGMPTFEGQVLTGAESPGGGTWALSPSFTLVHLSGGPEGIYSAEGLLEYPGGRRVNAVAVIQVINGKIARQRTYFAALFEAPEWRANWVEKI